MPSEKLGHMGSFFAYFRRSSVLICAHPFSSSLIRANLRSSALICAHPRSSALIYAPSRRLYVLIRDACSAGTLSICIVCCIPPQALIHRRVECGLA